MQLKRTDTINHLCNWNFFFGKSLERSNATYHSLFISFNSLLFFFSALFTQELKKYRGNVLKPKNKIVINRNNHGTPQFLRYIQSNIVGIFFTGIVDLFPETSFDINISYTYPMKFCLSVRCFFCKSFFDEVYLEYFSETFRALFSFSTINNSNYSNYIEHKEKDWCSNAMMKS